MPDQTQNPKKFNIDKVFATLGLVLIITIIIFAVYWIFLGGQKVGITVDDTDVKVSTSSARQSTSSATNWQTYTNSEIGFSLKYPTDWNYTDNQSQSKESCPTDTPGLHYTHVALFGTADLKCAVIDDTWPGNLLVMKNDTEYQPLEQLGTAEKYTYLTLDGEKAAKNFRTPTSDGPRCMCTRLYVNHNGKGFEIEFVNKDDLGNYDSIYDTILSTFKFL